MTQPVSLAKSLSPPFSKDRSIVTLLQVHHPVAIIYGHQLLRPREDPRNYLDCELNTPKLNLIHQHLWLAGVARPARPLHRQKLLDRTIYLTESPDEHLVWHELRIFVKPLPEFLLNFEYWEKELCGDEDLYKCACGLLLSYIWLVGHKSDLHIAHETGVFPKEVDWLMWTSFVEDFLSNMNLLTLHQVNKRYQYGELRLSRLNSLYRYTPSVFSVRNFMYGFMSSSTWYKAFFERNFAWLLAVFVYVTVILSAMQVGLATERLQGNLQFQEASYSFAITSIVTVVAMVGVILLMWVVLFCYHLGSTMQYTRHVRSDKERRLYDRH